MASETVVDILREMGTITEKTEHSAETMVVVTRYAVRLAKAYKREIDNQKQMIPGLKEVLNGNDK